MMSPHLLLKTAHVLSATIVFGTGLGIAFFCWFGSRDALRKGEIAALRAVLRLTVIADMCFTAPAIAFQLISGAALMQINGWSLTSPWALTVAGLFALAGACWLPVVAIQMRLLRDARTAATIDALGANFHSRFRVWLMLGGPAFSALIIIFYLMVAKPLSLS